MRRALELAARGWGRVSPNPLVGCVLVRDGRVVAEGWHEGPGTEHAEAMALRLAGERAAGSTAFVTLEPCDHHGRTPPCARALIRAGVEGVIAATGDPNPIVDGSGFRALRDAGLTVEEGSPRRRSDPTERRLPHPRPHRPAVREAEDGLVPGREGRRSGRVLEVDHGRRGSRGRPASARVGRCRGRRLGHGARRRPSTDRARPRLRVGAAAGPGDRGSVRSRSRRPAGVRCGRADARRDDGARADDAAAGVGGRRRRRRGAGSRCDRRRVVAGAGRAAREARRAGCVARGRSHPRVERDPRWRRRPARPVPRADAGRRTRGNRVARREAVSPRSVERLRSRSCRSTTSDRT